MATSKTLELSIKIAGRMDKSLTAAINGTQSKIGSLTKSISNIGTVGLATMGAVATAAAVGIAGCTKEAQALESAMAPVVRYVDGLADASGAASDAIADNGKTFKQNYGALKTYIQDLSTDIPRTTDQLTAMSAALGQSGIGVDKQLTTASCTTAMRPTPGTSNPGRTMVPPAATASAVRWSTSSTPK